VIFFSQGSNSVLYTSRPYAVTFKMACTFCSCADTPARSKVTLPAALSYLIFIRCTWMPDASRHVEKPLVSSTSAA